MKKSKLFVMSLSGLLIGGVSFAGQIQKPGPGEQVPGQQSPGQQTGQQVPGQQTGQQVPGQQTGQQVPGQQTGQQVPGQQVYQYPQFGVQLSFFMHNNVPNVYVYKLTTRFGTLARLGLLNGDIIYSIAQQRITTPAQARDMMGYLEWQRRAQGRPILVPLQIARGGQWYTWQAVLN